MVVVRILVGVALLTLGRQLFWLFVGGMGFVFAAELAAQSFPEQPNWVIALIAVLAGLFGALFAVLLQRVAVAAAGFLAAGYLAMSVFAGLGGDATPYQWIPFLLGGLVGAVLVTLVFDWAIIALSSLVGAALVVQSLQVDALVSTLLFAGLLVGGIIIQTRLWRPA